MAKLRHGLMGAALIALIGASTAVTTAHAQTSPSDNRTFGDTLTASLQIGDFAGALALIETRPDLKDRPEGVRLHAELLFRTGRTDAAIAELEGHLTRQTDDALARFQLAEMHLSAGRLPQAAFNYRLARAGTLDATRKGIVEARLRAISSRQGWQGQFSASLGPDSNVNSATAARSIEIFGLPFDLSADGRRRSGVSASISGVLEGRAPLGASSAGLLTLSAGAQGELGGGYEVVDGSVAAGVERRAASGAKLTLQPFVGVRTFDRRLLDRRWGLRGGYDGPLTSDVQWSVDASAERSDDQLSDTRDGWGYALSAVRTRYLGPSALRQVSVSAVRRDLASPSESFNEIDLTAGRLFAMPFATLGYARVGAAWRRFDDASPLFGEVREDHTLDASLRVSKRDWSVWGAMPFVQATISRSDSTLPLSAYRRGRLEFGFTRDF